MLRFPTIIYVPDTAQGGKPLFELKDITGHTNATAVYAVMNKFKLETRRFLTCKEVQVQDCLLRRIVQEGEGRRELLLRQLITFIYRIKTQLPPVA